MRFRSSVLILLLAALPGLADRLGELPGSRPGFFFSVSGGAPGPWTSILSATGLTPGEAGDAAIVVVRGDAEQNAKAWRARADSGAYLILEGGSPVAAAFGFRAGDHRVRVRNVRESRAPELEVIWEKERELPEFKTPPGARIFARERWSGAPLVAGLTTGAGGVLWLATDPGLHGYERFPYLLADLYELGWRPPFRSRRLWAFLDTAYRTRVDLAWFARRWRRAGIAAVHVSAWHYFEPDPSRDKFLRTLVRECHRNAILVYAWFELPHVSEQFWRDHPEWREKTAILQDAHLDWRRLMNLANPDCARAVAGGVSALFDRFDWDGVNLAELYFESLEGTANPARFTPMNDDVRAEFRKLHGIDPLELFKPGASSEKLQEFAGYRAELAGRLQEEWIDRIESIRRRKPHLDLVLTHVDDHLDPEMRRKIGVSSARALPLLDRHDFTFLVEDPATVWDSQPERYTEAARYYTRASSHPEKLALDINIVERYQDVYPTTQQTGTELLRQLNLATRAFPRVAIYAEHSLVPADLPLIPAAAAGVTGVEQENGKLVVTSEGGAGVRWAGPALVDGHPWPVRDGETVWIPSGTHVLEAGAPEAGPRLLEFNGDVQQASSSRGVLDLVYTSGSRAFAVLESKPTALRLDGVDSPPALLRNGNEWVLTLPRGQHVASLRFAKD